MEIEKREARQRLTLAHASWREAADISEAYDRFATALRYRLGGMIEMFCIIFPEDHIDCDIIMLELESDYNAVGPLPR